LKISRDAIAVTASPTLSCYLTTNLLAQSHSDGIKLMFMKALGNSISTKAVLIPVIMTVSLFLAFLGMRTPDLPHIQKPKGHQRAIIENQVKEARTGIQNSGQDFELSRRCNLIEPPSFHVSSLRLTYRSISYVKLFSFRSRAPPDFLV
jgi:hypothetical protein